ncbi:MAG: RluA family pseudouridine synthase [Acidobacteria bacterium]|nr:RluA family pseudouridine synthase [Acidobacteriota bacterium]
MSVRVERGKNVWTVPDEAAGSRLDKFLAATERLGSRGGAADALARGKVFVNGTEARPSDGSRTLRAGDAVRVWMDRPGSARRPGGGTAGELEILYEDDALIVVNKPAGLLAVPLQQRPDASSAYGYIEDHLRSRTRRRPLVVHRIDRDTSGLVVFAKNTRVQEQLKAQFERREPERVYWAVVSGHPRPPQGSWRDELAWDVKALVQTRAHPRDPRKKEAISHYRVLETFRSAALVEVRLETGKRNQIRIQARLHGHPIVGERLYVDAAGLPRSSSHGSARPALRTIDCARQALHAHRLSFRHPVDGRPLTFEAPLPRDLEDLLTRLRARPSATGARGAPSRPASRT